MLEKKVVNNFDVKGSNQKPLVIQFTPATDIPRIKEIFKRKKERNTAKLLMPLKRVGISTSELQNWRRKPWESE